MTNNCKQQQFVGVGKKITESPNSIEPCAKKEEPVQQNRLRDRCSSVRTPVTTTIVVVRENSIISHKRSGKDHLGSGQVSSGHPI
jgi:hypothetical protein